MGTREGDVAEALALLEEPGATIRVETAWIVRSDRKGNAREILSRGKPVLLAIARQAAEHATPAQAAARDKIGGISGDGRPQTRADAYRDMMKLVALASQSRFHAEALGRLLDEAADMFVPIAERDMHILSWPNVDGELVRLARAIMARDPDAAEAAMGDHLLILALHMDALPEN